MGGICGLEGFKKLYPRSWTTESEFIDNSFPYSALLMDGVGGSEDMRLVVRFPACFHGSREREEVRFGSERRWPALLAVISVAVLFIFLSSSFQPRLPARLLHPQILPPPELQPQNL